MGNDKYGCSVKKLMDKKGHIFFMTCPLSYKYWLLSVHVFGYVVFGADDVDAHWRRNNTPLPCGYFYSGNGIYGNFAICGSGCD